MPARLPQRMRPLFWETTPARIDLTRDAAYVMARVLEFGRMQDVRWLMKRYGLGAIHVFLATSGHPEPSPRTLAFWRVVLHAEEENWRTLRRALLPLFIVASASCAPLHLIGKSENCQREYDACLNGCPQPRKRANPNNTDLQIEVAACTQHCNDLSSSCK